MSDITLIIFTSAVLTYLTRIGGHLILSRFGALNSRLEAGLNAVPAAVLTTLVAPTFLTHTWQEAVALTIAGLAALRLPLLGMFAVGWIAIVALRFVSGT
jgi:uncharacterized membrane protein